MLKHEQHWSLGLQHVHLETFESTMQPQGVGRYDQSCIGTETLRVNLTLGKQIERSHAESQSLKCGLR